jgi:hypothetical protein
MEKPLLSPITKRFTDRSTANRFAFIFYCDRCGKEWRSSPQAFRTIGMQLPMDLQVVRMLWNDQHKTAYKRANLEGAYVFTRCPECGCRVCMECFSRSEMDIMEICADCLE